MTGTLSKMLVLDEGQRYCFPIHQFRNARPTIRVAYRVAYRVAGNAIGVWEASFEALLGVMSSDYVYVLPT